MSDFAIRAIAVSKQYKIGYKPIRSTTLTETLSNAITSPFIKGRKATEVIADDSKGTIWALKDVSFEVKKGEVLGIIGKNGSGKSTLLKILSGITLPTVGQLELTGRVGSLLEVGTGFHPELTGRENVYLNGAILGIKKNDIHQKFDEIVAFAEIERFLDTPVKHYSSGMYMRLAFAVAAHLNPEILVLDEVLAVGDLAFQKKCLGKMDTVSKDGRTVIFVSHSMGAIRKLCHRVIFFEKGQIKAHGAPAEVILQYVEGVSSVCSTYTLPPPSEIEAPGRAETLVVGDHNGSPATSIPVGQPWQVTVSFMLIRRVDHFMIALGLRAGDDFMLRTSWSAPCSLEPGQYKAIFREENILLGTGRYTLMVGLSSHERTFHYIEAAGFLDIAGFSEGIDLVRVSGVGAILNPLNVKIMTDDKSD